MRLFHGPAGYVGVFSVLVACGLGLPLPEDVALITGGYLAALGTTRGGVGSLSLMMLTGLVGILVGDSIIFRAGGVYGDKLLDTKLGKHIPKERVDRTRELFGKHGPKMIVVARFLPGVRAVTYFVAGSSRVPYWKFVTYDGVAACASAPLWVWLGYRVGRHHARMMQFLETAKHVQIVIFGVVVALLVLFIGFRVWRGRRAKAAAAEEQRLLASSAAVPTPAPRNGSHGVEVPATPGSSTAEQS